MTCDNTTDVCPGTELTCACSVTNAGLVWTLPGPGEISIDDKGQFTNNVTTNGIFVAVIIILLFTNNTGGVLESMLIYTATESLVDATIECSGNEESVSTTITVTLAG